MRLRETAEKAAMEYFGVHPTDKNGIEHAATQQMADVIERVAEAYAETLFCKECLGTKCCALRAGHSTAHTSMSGSCWPIVIAERGE